MTTIQEVYFVPGVPYIFLSITACSELKLIHMNFPFIVVEKDVDTQEQEDLDTSSSEDMEGGQPGITTQLVSSVMGKLNNKKDQL